MLIDKLKQWQYYLTKFPLYLRNSYGFTEHFKIIFDLLLQLDLLEDQLLKCFDVMASDYLDFINNLSGSQDESDILDKIASLYGVRRNFDLTIDDETKALSLNNNELLILIKARIIQFNFDGTYAMTKQFYENVKLPVFIYNSGNAGIAKLFLDTSQIESISDNIVDMFNAGLFTIESMGITYTTESISLLNIFVWDTTESNRYWDEGLRL